MASEPIAGFAHVDDKGRVSLAKSVRVSLGLEAGSALAWLKLGNGVLFIPQDEHVEHLMQGAAEVFERANIDVQAMLDDLPAVRDEVVTEHYGEEFMRTLETLRRQHTPESMS